MGTRPRGREMSSAPVSTFAVLHAAAVELDELEAAARARAKARTFPSGQRETVRMRARVMLEGGRPWPEVRAYLAKYGALISYYPGSADPK